jgi:hypothetical protein
MQDEYRTCESHNQGGRAKRPKFVEIAADSVPDPNYDRCEPDRLQPQRDHHHTNRYVDLTN